MAGRSCPRLPRSKQCHGPLAREEGQSAVHGPPDRGAGGQNWRLEPLEPLCEGENVLDLFGGSGSTLICAEQTGRHAFLMELDQLYCDVIVQRRGRSSAGRKAKRVAARRWSETKKNAKAKVPA